MLKMQMNKQIFFFQAEDGIRDLYVTGVQTCALPIWRVPAQPAVELDAAHPLGDPGAGLLERSEERRVGKECRSRIPPDHQKKKEKSIRDRTTEKKQGKKTEKLRIKILRTLFENC